MWLCYMYKLLLQLTGSKPLHLAALKGNMDVMRILITECGCKADLGDEVGMITWHILVYLTTIAMTTLFNITPHRIAQTGDTALHYSAAEGHLSAMRILVKEFKVNPDVVNKVSMILVSCLPVYVICIAWWLCNHGECIHCMGDPCKWDRLEGKIGSEVELFTWLPQKVLPIAHSQYNNILEHTLNANSLAEKSGQTGV